MKEWLIDNWLKIAVPALVVVACYAVGLWLRGVVDSAFKQWTAKTKWEGSQLVVGTARRPFLFWFLLLGIGIAIQVSILPEGIKNIAEKTMGCLFIFSLGWVAIALSEQLLKLYLPKIKAPQPTIALAVNAVRICVIVISALGVLDIWGIPTTPLLLLIAIAALGAMLALRNVVPNVFAWFQLEASRQIKVGDYVRLETGEEGYVVEINWNNTRIKALDDSTIIVPNNWLLQRTVTNYGDPLKKGREAFRFNSSIHFTELARTKAEGIRGLADVTAAGKTDSARAPETKSSLSAREKEIAGLISEGIGNREIAQRLFIAENTVKVHVKNILKKLELRNRQQLAAYTVLQNWATANEGKTQNAR